MGGIIEKEAFAVNVGDVLRRLMRPVAPNGRPAPGSTPAVAVKATIAAAKGIDPHRAADVAGPESTGTKSAGPPRYDVMALSAPAANAQLPGWGGETGDPVALAIWEDPDFGEKDAFRRAYRIELTMRPPHLGRVKVVLWAWGRDLHVQFQCDEADAAEAMAPRMAELVEALESMFRVRTTQVAHRPEAPRKKAELSVDEEPASGFNVSV